MTQVNYTDPAFKEAFLSEISVYKVKKDESLVSRSQQEEKTLTERVRNKGFKVLSVVSQPINKRRYKRMYAKLIKKVS
jgi:hypothetical protein